MLAVRSWATGPAPLESAANSVCLPRRAGALKEERVMGAVRDHSIIIACIGAGSAIVAAFAKPMCDTLFGSDPQPQGGTVAAAPLNPTRPETPIRPTPEDGTPVAAQPI